MLEWIDGKPVSKVPRLADFNFVVARLGADVAESVGSFLNRAIDGLPRTPESGLRSFNSSYLGSQLSPWPEPLAQLYNLARTVEGPNANEEAVQHRASLWFGLFVWERVMKRSELWTVYDPNLEHAGANREPMGKTYLERPPSAGEPLLSRITIDPAICHGKPCVRGLRYPVENLLELLSANMTIDEILADYEDLERDDLLAVLAFATKLSRTKSLQPVGP